MQKSNDAMNQLRRRNLLKASGAAIVGAALPLSSADARDRDAQDKRLHALVTGGHPDDPETGCGGAICRYTSAGHHVTVLYLTRGQAGIEGKTAEQAAGIRTAEAEKACQIMGATPLFADQIDGTTQINAASYRAIFDTVRRVQPDLMFTHWPIDTHRDHRICSNLVYDASRMLDEKVPLYYYEVMSGMQSQTFRPTDYVDITAVIETKHEACFVHRSQNIEPHYANGHGRMEVFRGMEGNFQYAEAFVRHTPGPSGRLP